MAAWVKFLQYQDRRILYWFNHSLNCRILDILMYIVTQFGSLPVILLLTLFCLYSSNPALANVGSCLVIVLVCSQIIVHLLKWLTSRPRPFNVLNNVISRRRQAPGFSFPSGHSCAAFAAAITLSPVWPADASWLMGLAILVGISRIYLGVHYPSDVLAGYFIAVGVYWFSI